MLNTEGKASLPVDSAYFAQECAASLQTGNALSKGLADPRSAVFPHGGLNRPWVKKIPKGPRRLQPSNTMVHLWEGGNTTTLEIKQEIQDLLSTGYTLVETIDSKRAERPGDPNWWPSLMEVLVWTEFDQAFAKMLDAWNYAHQFEILEAITLNVMNPVESGLTEKFLKIQSDFAAKVLPRIVNKGMADRVEVNSTNMNLNQAAQKMSDDAIKARLAELSQNPRVLKLIIQHQEIGIAEVKVAQKASPGLLLDPTPMKPGAAFIEGLDIPDIDGEIL